MNWFSHGKLLLTGEYLVLFGAKALAMPVKLGQTLDVAAEEDGNLLEFTTTVQGKPWFYAKYQPGSLELLETNQPQSANYVQQLLQAAQKLNSGFLQYPKHIQAKADVQFDIQWGLGSSSTLISNIAWWAHVDPYELNGLISKGSGYDIACARHQTPIFYSFHNQPEIEPVVFDPPCADQLWFVYLGKKQPTETNIRSALTQMNASSSEVQEISQLSEAFAFAQTPKEFSQLIHQHEQIIGRLISQTPIQQRQFPDFKGVIKSLGAWGGDFCLAISEENPAYVKRYFGEMGLGVVFGLGDLRI